MSTASKSVSEMLQEVSRSKAELNLKRITYEISRDELKRKEVELERERTKLNEELAILEEEKEQWMKLKATSSDNLKLLSYSTNMVSSQLEVEEDVLSLGLPSNFTLQMGMESNFSMLMDETSGVERVGPLFQMGGLPSTNANSPRTTGIVSVNKTEAQILRDKVSRLQQLLHDHNVEIPQDLMSIMVPGLTASTREVHLQPQLLPKQPSVKIQESSNVYSEYGDDDKKEQSHSHIKLENIATVRDQEEIREDR